MSEKFVAIASAARSSVVDAAALDQALRQHLRGDVRFDSSSRALYATDGSNYRQVPIGVVLPRDADDVIAAVALAREYGAPFSAAAAELRSPDNAATSPWCSISPATWATSWRSIPQRRIARVQPGVVLDHLRNAAEKHHLTFAPGPGHPRPLHSRRHDRQQLLRRAFRHGRQDRRQHRSTRRPHL